LKGICILAAGYLEKRGKEVAGLTYICSYCSGRKRLVVCKYNSYLVEQKELVRPRVLTYIRKSLDLRIQQRHSVYLRDLLWLDVNGYLILNVYRQPGTNLVIDYVTKLVSLLRCIVRGDFNVYHDFFKPGVNTFLCEGELVK
jgi:hypothetical protein